MNDNTANDIIDARLGDILGEKYLAYALSTITARSLPDVRDGLKPVHRRVLYAMSLLNLGPDTMPKKSARVVGDVIGRFHPHGDQAVYDALVRLAQDFASRWPLVDGQGNFGNIDGDNAAAMRYTEARLTAVARRMLEGLNENAVDFRDTYDGDGNEPEVLPANFPNLLANGAHGIAVGMATSIPPHNVAELSDGLMHLLKYPNAGVETLVDRIPGPDFPTGGVLVEERANIIQAYTAGRGAFRLRARWETEKLPNGTWQVVVTEIPYQVQKARLIEKIAELLNTRKLPMLEDVRDESAEDVRLVLVPKSRNIDPAILMESLFRATDLEARIQLNMNVLDGGRVPRVMNLREVLQAFLDHRLDVLVRRSRHRLEKINHRLEVLDGYLIAYLNLDEVIRIIREEDEPKQEMMKAFGLSDVQAEAILNMRLRSLRKLEEFEIRREHKALSDERDGLILLLEEGEDGAGRRRNKIHEELKALKKEFGPGTIEGRRRTEIGDAPAPVAVPLEAMVEREPLTVLLSKRGWIRAMKGHVNATGDIRYKDGDEEGFVLHAHTTDRILLFATNGRMYTLPADKLPGGRGFGEPLRLMIDLPDGDDVVTMLRHDPFQRKAEEAGDADDDTAAKATGDTMLILASTEGRGLQVAVKDVLAQTKGGKQLLNVSGKVKAAMAHEVAGDHVAVIGKNRKLLVFPVEQIPVMTRGKGVILQKYKDGGLSDLKSFNLADGLTWPLGERTRTEDMRPWAGNRAGQGKLPPTGFPKNNRFS